MNITNTELIILLFTLFAATKLRTNITTYTLIFKLGGYITVKMFKQKYSAADSYIISIIFYWLFNGMSGLPMK